MANNEKYIFEVEARTNKAIEQLKAVEREIREIERIRNRGFENYQTTNQKDMDKAMRNMAKITDSFKQMDTQIEQIKQKMISGMESIVIPKDAADEEINMLNSLRTAYYQNAQAAKRQQSELRKEYRETLRTFRQLSDYQQNYSRNFKHIFSSNDIYNMPQNKERARKIMTSMTELDDGTESFQRVNDMLQSVRRLDRRTESLARRAEASRYMSYQQATNFAGDVSRVQSQYMGWRRENIDSLAELGMERARLMEEIKHIETDPEATQSEIDKKIALQQTVKEIDKEIELRKQLQREIIETQKRVEKRNRELQELENLEVKPERGTFRGMIYERAPAVGLAWTGAAGLMFGGLYAQGSGLKDQIRDDVIAIGQRTGSTNWRDEVRNPAISGGLMDRLGMSATEMLRFQQTYLTNRGFTSRVDLEEAMMNQAYFSRITGTSSDRASQFFESVFSSASVSGDSVRNIQNAFVGAIKQSGMEGREESQLEALEGILDEMSRGRRLSEHELMNVMGLQSVLASSGVEGLRGTRGGELLAGLSAGIRNAVDDPSNLLMFGMGTQYQGLSGYTQLVEKLEKGIADVDNVALIGRIAESFGTSEDEQAAVAYRFIRGNLGVDATMEQVKGLLDLYRSGQLTQDNIEQVLEGDMATGSSLAEERYRNYTEQKEATELQSRAVTERQAIHLNDLGDAVRSVNAAMGGMPAIIYATIGAFASLVTAVLGTAASFKLSEWVRRGAAMRYGGGAGFPGQTRMDRHNKGGMPPFGGGGGWFGLFGDWSGGGSDGRRKADPNTRTGRRQQRRGGRFSWIRDLFGGGGGNNSLVYSPTAGSPSGGVLNRILGPLALLSGFSSIVSAPEGERAEAAGEMFGGLGGAWGGGSLGAKIGSFFGPWGTAIGSAGGAILGGVFGGNLGEKVGGWIGNAWDGVKGWAGDAWEGVKDWWGGLWDWAKPRNEGSDMSSQLERENTTKKEQTERQRADNIRGEKELLSNQENLMRQGKDWLTNLRSTLSGMAGIFGAGSSVGAGTSVSNFAGSTNAERIWNFLTGKGFSPAAAAGILGNLQQESGLDPTAVNSSSGAFGIGQWLGGRKTNLFNFAQQRGLDPKSLEAQLEFMWHELQGGDPTTANLLQKYGGLSSLMDATDPASSARIFEKAFERSGGSRMDKRVQYAQDFYNQFGTRQTASATRSSGAYATTPLSVDSTIRVVLEPGQNLADKVVNNKSMTDTAKKIHEKIYGAMNYYARDMVRV